MSLKVIYSRQIIYIDCYYLIDSLRLKQTTLPDRANSLPIDQEQLEIFCDSPCFDSKGFHRLQSLVEKRRALADMPILHRILVLSSL